MLNIYRMLIAQMAKIFLRFPPSDKKILPPPQKNFPFPQLGRNFPPPPQFMENPGHSDQFFLLRLPKKLQKLPEKSW